MSDTFNPHEILSRLRSKPGLNNSNGTANNNVSTNGSTSSSSNPKASNSKAIKTPQSLTLTATQRQDNLAVRNELEKEIKRLQDEITALKTENKQLKADKEDAEKQFMDLKAKTDETVTKLRGKIAALTNHRGSAEGTGKVYPPPPPSLLNGSKPLAPNTPKSPGPTTINKAAGGKASASNNFSSLGNPESFREPTFSELMRRGTNEHPDFQESLRKVPLPSAPIVSSNANHNSTNANMYPFENSKGASFKSIPLSNNSNTPNFLQTDSFLAMQEMKSPAGHYGFQSQVAGNSNNRNGPLNFHMDHHPNHSYPSDNYPPSSSTPNSNIPNTPGFNAHHNVFNSSKHHPNLYYNNSSTHPSSDIMMLPGRDDNIVLIPNRKGSVHPTSASAPLEANINNNMTNNGDSIPIVEIDLS